MTDLDTVLAAARVLDDRATENLNARKCALAVMKAFVTYHTPAPAAQQANAGFQHAYDKAMATVR